MISHRVNQEKKYVKKKTTLNLITCFATVDFHGYGVTAKIKI